MKSMIYARIFFSFLFRQLGKFILRWSNRNVKLPDTKSPKKPLMALFQDYATKESEGVVVRPANVLVVENTRSVIRRRKLTASQKYVAAQ